MAKSADKSDAPAKASEKPVKSKEASAELVAKRKAERLTKRREDRLGERKEQRASKRGAAAKDAAEPKSTES